MLRQRRHVGQAFAQRRHPHRQHAEPVKKIFAKAAFGHGTGQVGVRGRDHPNIDRLAAAGTHLVDGVLLQKAQQVGLQLQRQVGNLIQKQGAAGGCLNQAGPSGHGAGERAALVAKEF